MTNKLSSFLIKMGENLEIQHEYANDPEKVMAEYGLSDKEKAAIRSGNERRLLGDIGRDDIIICKLIVVIPKPR